LADRVHFVGFRREVADYLAAADLFVFPSEIEGLGLAMVEAMWMGVPVIAADIPAVRETLRQGLYGQLVPPSDPGVLASAISALAAESGKRHQLAERARGYAQAHFAPERYAREVCQLWHRLLTAKGIGQDSDTP
jgi:glycosyltransferase involved in cell wall biosynthesis